jgi:hypothetical protein
LPMECLEKNVADVKSPMAGQPHLRNSLAEKADLVSGMPARPHGPSLPAQPAESPRWRPAIAGPASRVIAGRVAGE